MSPLNSCSRVSRRLITLAALAILVLAPPLAAQQTLTVFAAASLGDAYRSLGTQFQATHPGSSCSAGTCVSLPEGVTVSGCVSKYLYMTSRLVEDTPE